MTSGVDVSNLSDGGRIPASAGLSIVVPAFNEGAGLEPLHARLCNLAATLKQRYGLTCEVVYVDDGSTDTTLSVARNLAANALDVQVVSLSRNFGKEAALMAGLDHARRGAVLFMDGDGQHAPELVEKLVGHWIDDGVMLRSHANLVASRDADWSPQARDTARIILDHIAASARARKYKEVRTRFAACNDALLTEAHTRFGVVSPFGGPTSSGMLTLHCPPSQLYALASFLRTHGADTVSIASLDYVYDRENPLFAKLEAFLNR